MSKQSANSDVTEAANRDRKSTEGLTRRQIDIGGAAVAGLTAAINTASVSGHKGFTEFGPYSVSKPALLRLTKVASLKYAKDNIRITSISPDGVDKPMLRAVWEHRGISCEAGAKAIPIGRTNTVEELVRTVMLLAADDASAFHGSLVDVTSGILD